MGVIFSFVFPLSKSRLVISYPRYLHSGYDLGKKALISPGKKDENVQLLSSDFLTPVSEHQVSGTL